MRFRVVLGILLILVGVAAMILLVLLPTISPEDPFVLNMMQSIACDPGQKAEIEVRVTHDSDGTGYTPILTCIGREGERIDASGKHFAIGIIAFIVPFLLGLSLTIAGAGKWRRSTPQTVWMPGSKPEQVGFTTSSVPSSTFGSSKISNSSPKVEVKDGVLNVDGIEIRMDGLKPEHLKVFEGMSTPIVMSSSMSASGGAVTLAAKLKEIQEARDSGLITSTEYDKLRQEILDKLA